MSVSLHRFMLIGNQFQLNQQEYEIDERNLVLTNSKKTISLFETATEETHYFPSTKAQNDGTCFYKKFNLENDTPKIIVSENLQIVRDHSNLELKYWLKPSNEQAKTNREQKRISHHHWSLIPRKPIPQQQFYDEVESFFQGFQICRLVASAEYYLYPYHDKPQDSQILFQIFELASLNENMLPMVHWRYASTLSFLELHSLKNTLTIEYHRCSIFLFVQQMIRWEHFCLNQELLAVIHMLENEWGMDIDDDASPRKYKILADNPIQTSMSHRLVFHGIHVMNDLLPLLNIITVNQQVFLEKVLSGSVRYVYSFANEPIGLEKRQELIDNTEGLLSIGYCNVLQTLCVKPEQLIYDYKQLYKIPAEQTASFFKAFKEKCQQFIQHSLLSAEHKYTCMEMMEDLICDMPLNEETISTIYLHIFDDGSCQIGTITNS